MNRKARNARKMAYRQMEKACNKLLANFMKPQDFCDLLDRALVEVLMERKKRLAVLESVCAAASLRQSDDDCGDCHPFFLPEFQDLKGASNAHTTTD